MTDVDLIRLVAKLEQKLEDAVRRIEEAAGDTGYPRCAVHSEQITNLEEAIKEHKGSHKWFSRSLAAVLLAALVNILITLIKTT